MFCEFVDLYLADFVTGISGALPSPRDMFCWLYSTTH